MSSGPPIDPLPHELAALLDAERERAAMPAAAQGRVLSRLGPLLGPPPGAGPSGGTGGSPPATPPAVPLPPVGAAASALGALGKLAAAHLPAVVLAAAATVGVAGVGVRAVVRHRAEVAARAAHAPAAVTALPPVARTTQRAQPEPATAAPAPPAATEVAPQDPTATRELAGDGGTLRAEQALLASASASSTSGRIDEALALLARHEAAFPHGQLTQERESMRIQILFAAQRADDARARAAQFRAAHPQSIFLPVIDQAEAQAQAR